MPGLQSVPCQMLNCANDAQVVYWPHFLPEDSCQACGKDHRCKRYTGRADQLPISGQQPGDTLGSPSLSVPVTIWSQAQVNIWDPRSYLCLSAPDSQLDWKLTHYSKVWRKLFDELDTGDRRYCLDLKHLFQNFRRNFKICWRCGNGMVTMLDFIGYSLIHLKWALGRIGH